MLSWPGGIDPSHRNIAASQSLSLPVTALTPSVSIETSRRAAVKYSWSIRGRVGYAFGGTLAYATGGYASARMHFRADNILTNPGGPAAPCTPNCTANLGPEGPNDSFEGSMYANRGGWTGGLGVEQRLMRHLSIGLEYRHTDFGDYDLGPVASGTLFTGPFTHGSDGGTGQHLTVYDSGSRRRLSSDSIGLRANFRF